MTADPTRISRFEEPRERRKDTKDMVVSHSSTSSPSRILLLGSTIPCHTNMKLEQKNVSGDHVVDISRGAQLTLLIAAGASAINSFGFMSLF